MRTSNCSCRGVRPLITPREWEGWEVYVVDNGVSVPFSGASLCWRFVVNLGRSHLCQLYFATTVETRSLTEQLPTGQKALTSSSISVPGRILGVLRTYIYMYERKAVNTLFPAHTLLHFALTAYEIHDHSRNCPLCAAIKLCMFISRRGLIGLRCGGFRIYILLVLESREIKLSVIYYGRALHCIFSVDSTSLNK